MQQVQTRMLAAGLAVTALQLMSCGSNGEEYPRQNPQQKASNGSTKVAYKGIVDEIVFIFKEGQMYSGLPPIWDEDEGVEGAFVSTVRTAADIPGAECIFPAPPMDEIGGTIAFGRPPNNEFEGSFTCGKFRFEVESCAALEVNCGAKYIRVFSIPNDRYINYQLWDECRGVYLISSSDLVEVPADWKHAAYPIGGQGLFGNPRADCLTSDDYE